LLIETEVASLTFQDRVDDPPLLIIELLDVNVIEGFGVLPPPPPPPLLGLTLMTAVNLPVPPAGFDAVSVYVVLVVGVIVLLPFNAVLRVVVPSLNVAIVASEVDQLMMAEEPEVIVGEEMLRLTVGYMYTVTLLEAVWNCASVATAVYVVVVVGV
jgi:hypothetical protein